MTNPTILKLVLGVLALIVFAVGARTDNAALRWVAVGILLVAVALRFRRPRA